MQSRAASLVMAARGTPGLCAGDCLPCVDGLQTAYGTNPRETPLLSVTERLASPFPFLSAPGRDTLVWKVFPEVAALRWSGPHQAGGGSDFWVGSHHAACTILRCSLHAAKRLTDIPKPPGCLLFTLSHSRIDWDSERGWGPGSKL